MAPRRRCLGLFLPGILLLFFAGCAGHVTERGSQKETPADSSGDRLRDALAALHPTVSPLDASRVSGRAHAVSRQLARQYRASRSPHFQNFLVNSGFRKRGLCFHWAEDLMGELRELKLATLELHWAEARPGTLREHNSVVVTARGQPFAEGIVLDAWRHSGRLFWSPLRADHYPWSENATYYKHRISIRP